MKTSPHKFLLLPLLLFTQLTVASQAFDCVKELMPITDRGSFQRGRKGTEAPFLVNDRYLVFPEISEKRVTGFYIYDKTDAWYYDTIQTVLPNQTRQQSIRSLPDSKRKVLYEMIVQPRGLETVAISYLPGYAPASTNSEGATMLGASVLPVIGAVVSRPDMRDQVYRDPKLDDQDAIKRWMITESGGRLPASVESFKPPKKIVRLGTRQPKSETALWLPLKTELTLRKRWIQNNNLDEQTFRDLNRALQTSCKQD